MRCTCGKIIGDYIDSMMMHMQKYHGGFREPPRSEPQTEAEAYLAAAASKAVDDRRKGRLASMVSRHRTKR